MKNYHHELKRILLLGTLGRLSPRPMDGLERILRQSWKWIKIQPAEILPWQHQLEGRQQDKGDYIDPK